MPHADWCSRTRTTLPPEEALRPCEDDAGQEVVKSCGRVSLEECDGGLIDLDQDVD